MFRFIYYKNINTNCRKLYLFLYCTRSRSAFWAIAGYSLSTNNQNASKLSSEWFNCNVLSLETLASSSSVNVNCSSDGSNSTNGHLTQSYWSTDIDGKYLLRFINKVSKWFKISCAIFGQLLEVLRNISKFPAVIRFFHIVTFF